ncbi:hypothetical protein QJS10_CPB12g01301 [Acorus calamus]|uniref:Uncharacterized protein n=1 Tax=Acorus calamus TaxID=4465 RepID=A0AAV9DLL9_ACOCL|nr:hypothetical protein QJS10_CPB12g01301 [Acorus calamus]
MLPMLQLQPSRTPPSLNRARDARHSSSPRSRLARPSSAKPPSLPFSSLSLRSGDETDPSSFASSVSPPPPFPLPRWDPSPRHVVFLNVVACAAVVSASWLFFSAIPALLAFKRTAESMEKLLDVTREELPGTMVSVRLSGMEISDLTMELSDLGQDIMQGVRSSTRAVRLAEDGLHRLTTMASVATMQEQVQLKRETEGPVLANTARSLREGIVKGRSVLGSVLSFTRFSRSALNFLAARRQKK